jgi:hypothetical protein
MRGLDPRMTPVIPGRARSARTRNPELQRKACECSPGFRIALTRVRNDGVSGCASATRFVLPILFSNSRQAHSSRAVSRGRSSREESAAKRNGLRDVPLSRNLSSRSALLRRSFHKAPGPRFRDPADFFRSPLNPLEAEIFKRRRFFLRTGVLHSSHPRQRPVIGADGDPKPPQIVAANHDRRRRPFPATRTPLDAPSMETTKRNIVLVEDGSQELFLAPVQTPTRSLALASLPRLRGRD